MTDADKLAFTKPPGFYWVKSGTAWTVVHVHVTWEDGRRWTMVSMPGRETKWSIYYFAEAEWGPKVEEPS